jgi:hypothetical protein
LGILLVTYQLVLLDSQRLNSVREMGMVSSSSSSSSSSSTTPPTSSSPSTWPFPFLPPLHLLFFFLLLPLLLLLLIIIIILLPPPPAPPQLSGLVDALLEGFAPIVLVLWLVGSFCIVLYHAARIAEEQESHFKVRIRI